MNGTWKMLAYKDSFSEVERAAAEAAVMVAFPDDKKVERHLSRDDLALIVASAVKIALKNAETRRRGLVSAFLDENGLRKEWVVVNTAGEYWDSRRRRWVPRVDGRYKTYQSYDAAYRAKARTGEPNIWVQVHCAQTGAQQESWS